MFAGRVTWRSWFWNIVLAVILFGVAVLVTATAFDRMGKSYNALNMAVGLPFAVMFWAGFVRSFMLGVSADSDGVVARLLLRTVKIRWAEIESIGGSGGVGGAAGAATAPAITWKRSDRTRTTDLNVLGSYNIVRGEKKPLGERAAGDLNARLARWRKENAK